MKAPHISTEMLSQFCDHYSFVLKIIDEKNYYNGLNASDICIVTSGTATLESAILEKPMVIVYKTSFLSWFIAKLFIKIPHIGLVNVVAGKKIIPECVQFDATAENISQHISNIISNETKIIQIKDELSQVKRALGHSGASLRAAEKIVELL
jgi:lipid-A-disaccharide synthase